eukprot:GHVU01158083.1.p1 GENE.GHVU01158083.1~~GHVU01158083.1.p1  ORF type:complete len:188 (-),score=39.01 GHVU01158083.1:733-1296(-)
MVAEDSTCAPSPRSSVATWHDPVEAAMPAPATTTAPVATLGTTIQLHDHEAWEVDDRRLQLAAGDEVDRYDGVGSDLDNYNTNGCQYSGDVDNNDGDEDGSDEDGSDEDGDDLDFLGGGDIGEGEYGLRDEGVFFGECDDDDCFDGESFVFPCLGYERHNDIRGDGSGHCPWFGNALLPPGADLRQK